MHHTIGRRDDGLIGQRPIAYEVFFGAPINEARSTLAQAWPSYTYQPFRKRLISRSSRQEIAFSSNQTFGVRLDMSYPNNGEILSLPKHNPRLPKGHQARYTAENVLRTRPKTYR